MKIPIAIQGIKLASESAKMKIISILLAIGVYFIYSCDTDSKKNVEIQKDTTDSYSDYEIYKIEDSQEVPLEGDKTLYLKNISDTEYFIRIFDSKDQYQDYTVDIVDHPELFEILDSYFEDAEPNIDESLKKIIELLGHSSSNDEVEIVVKKPVALGPPKETHTDNSPNNMIINYHTFEMSAGIAPIQNSTFRVSGMCGANCGGSTRAMGTHGVKDLFLVSWMSVRDSRPVGPTWTTGHLPTWWGALYKEDPQVGFEEYRHTGNVTLFKELESGKLEKSGFLSFENRCEAIHDITSNRTGTLIAFLCEGYPSRERLKKEPFNNIIDLLYGENNYCQYDDKPGVNCGGAGIRGGAAGSYILEYHNGLFDEKGEIKQRPDNVLLINTATGGWRYSHNEIHFLCDRGDNTTCNEEDGTGGRYIAQVKATIGSHEKTVGYIIDRPNDDNDKYEIKYHGGFGGGASGHGRASRLAYNKELNAVGKIASGDACKSVSEEEKQRYFRDQSASCQDAVWSKRSLIEGGQSGMQTILKRQVPSRKQVPNTQTGGIYGILSLGADGWMLLGAGPGLDYKKDGEQVPAPAAIGVMPVKEAANVEFKNIVDQWKWYNNSPKKLYNKLNFPDNGETNRMGFGNIAYFGENSETTQRLLFGGVRSLSGVDYPYDQDDTKKPLFFISEMNRAGDIIPNSNTMIEVGYGWGEDNRWVTMDSGCVVFPWANKKGVKGEYQRGGYGVKDRDKQGFNEQIKDDDGNVKYDYHFWYLEKAKTESEEAVWREGKAEECNGVKPEKEGDPPYMRYEWNTRVSQFCYNHGQLKCINEQGPVGQCKTWKWNAHSKDSRLSKELFITSVCPKPK